MKKKFKKQFTKRVFTRLHMTLILLGTILSGILFSKICLIAGLHHVIARFILVARKIDRPDWIGSVFRATWPAFALTFGITMIAQGKQRVLLLHRIRSRSR